MTAHRTSMLSLPASTSTPNEDYIAACESFIVLLDGATSLSDRHLHFQLPNRYRSESQWFAHTMGESIASSLRAKASHEQALKTALELVRSEWKQMGCSLDDKSMPSATLDIVTWDDEELTVSALGDSPVIVLDRWNIAEVVDGSGRLGEFADIRKRAIEKALIETGGDIDKARELAKPVIRKTREKKNTPEGYWIADLTDSWISHMAKESFPLDSISAVIAASNGYATAALDYKVVSSFTELARRICAGDGIDIANKVYTIESLDPKCETHPRTRLHDDSSFACVMFS